MDTQRITKKEILRKISKKIRKGATSIYGQKENAHLVFLDFFLKKFENNKCKKLLDIGCGHGRFLRKAKERGFDVEGTEIDDYAIEQNKKEGFKCKKVSICNVLPYLSNSFDGVFCHGVLEHIQDENGLLVSFHEFHRVLRPGGLLIVGVPNGVSNTFYDHPTHFRPYTKYTLRHLSTLTSFKKFKTYIYSSDFLIQYNIPFIKAINKCTKIKPLSNIISKIIIILFRVERDTLILEAKK